MFLCLFGAVFDDITRLAVQLAADRFERGKPDGLGLPVLEDREVGGRDVDPFGQFAERRDPALPASAGIRSDKAEGPAQEAPGRTPQPDRNTRCVVRGE